MKKFFTLIAAMVCAVCVNAENLPLDLTDLGSGWNSSYDPATKTITFDAAWTGRGWWFGEKDCSAYTKVVIETEPLAGYAKVVIEYASGSNSVGEAKAGDTKIEGNFNPEISSAVKQIYIQTDFAGTVVLKDAYLSQETVDLSIVWEGDANFGTTWDWNSTVGLSGGAFANLNSGDYIEFEYIINGEDKEHQLKALFGQWGNEEHNMIAAMKAVADATYDTINLEEGSTLVSYKLTDDDISTLKSDGLRISGKDITLTKIRSTSTPTGINNITSAPKAENNVRYNLLGVKNGNGIYIMNGKKYMK